MHEPSASGFLAIYGDDMEKAAGLGPWDKNAPAQFEGVLRWMNRNPKHQANANLRLGRHEPAFASSAY